MLTKELSRELTDYLISLIGDSKWIEAVLNIEIQPGMLGLNGYYLNDLANKVSLRTKPTDTIREKIKSLHINTAKDAFTKWNKLKLIVKPDLTTHEEFIWDQEWQTEIDNLNLKAIENDINYKLPKWHWEK